MGKENKQTFTYAAVPSIRDKAKRKAEKEGYSLSVRIEMFFREYIRPKNNKQISIEAEWRLKAQKWDSLGEKILKFYPENEEDDEFDSSDGLIGIGEAAATAYGFL